MISDKTSDATARLAPIEQWHPLPYVKGWLSAGRHAATDAGNAQKKTHANIVEKCFNMPTKLMNINDDRCLTVSIERSLSRVQNKFILLNPRSHSSVLAGSTAVIAVVSSWSQAPCLTPWHLRNQSQSCRTPRVNHRAMQ